MCKGMILATNWALWGPYVGELMSAIKNANMTYIVMGADRLGDSKMETIQRNLEMEFQLGIDGFEYKRGTSRFQGNEHSIFMISVPVYKDVKYLRRIAKEFEQKSILEIKQGYGWLLYSDGTEEYISSVFEATSREESYTQVGSKLFTIRKEA